MFKKCYIVFLMLVLTSRMFAQSNKRHLKEVMTDAQYYLDADNYFRAFQLYKEAIKIDPAEHLAGVDAAFCASKLNYPIDSIFQFQDNLIQTKNIDSKYYLAKVMHKLKQFDGAIELLNEYKKTDRKHHLKADDEIDYLIGICNSGKNLTANAHLADITNVGKNINSEFDDYVPVITPDENFMYFTSKRQNTMGDKKNGDNNYFEDVFVSQRKNGVWQKAENIGFPINSEDNDACVAIDAHASQMIVYRSTPNGASGHLYISKIGAHNHWGNLEPLSVEINSKYIETSACFSFDSTAIYFSSNRPGGYGGKDIYRINKLPNGRWGTASNLGSKINTKYDEDAPFLHPNGSTFYFSSKGHTTMGEYDVFRSSVNQETHEFSDVENLGYPINDVGNDIFFVLNSEGSRGYYSSIKEVNYGGEDIYQVDMRYNEKDMIVKEGYVYLENMPGKAKITIKDEKTNELLGEYYSNPNTGKFIIAVNPLTTYKITISSEGFEKIKTHLEPINHEANHEPLKFNLIKKSAQ